MIGTLRKYFVETVTIEKYFRLIFYNFPQKSPLKSRNDNFVKVG